MNPIRVTFDRSEADIREAVNYAFSVGPKRFLLPLLAVIGLLLAAGSALVGQPVVAGFFLFQAAVAVACGSFIKRSVIRRLVKENNEEDPGRTVTLSDEGIRIEWSRGDAIIDWDNVTAIVDRPFLYFVVLSDGPYPYGLPKRAFGDPSQLDAFHALVHRRKLGVGDLSH